MQQILFQVVTFLRCFENRAGCSFDVAQQTVILVLLFSFYRLSPLPYSTSELTSETMNPFRHLVGISERGKTPSQSHYIRTTTDTHPWFEWDLEPATHSVRDTQARTHLGPRGYSDYLTKINPAHFFRKKTDDLEKFNTTYHYFTHREGQLQCFSYLPFIGTRSYGCNMPSVGI
jgi:hypothetical protein